MSTWQPPPGGHPYQPPPPNNPKAVIAFCLGLAAIVFCCGPFTAVPAVIVGRMALREIDAAPGAFEGRGLAKAGLILGVIGIVLFLAFVAVVAYVYLSFDCSVFGTDGVPSYDCS